MKKIMILSVSAGQGHVRAAEALVKSTERWFADQAQARHVDLMELCPPWFRTAYKGSYVKFVDRFPTLWGLLYNRTDRDRTEGLMGQMRRRLESQVSKPLLKVMTEYQPDILVSTHFLPGQVLARWQQRGRLAPRPHWIVVTDFLAHRFWLEPGQTGYFTASEESAFTMRRRGLTKERIEISGIPIMPEFSDWCAGVDHRLFPDDQFRPERPSAAQGPIRGMERAEGAAAFGLDPARRVVLLMGGGEGLGVLKDIALELAGLPQDFQLAVLTGRNKRLLADLGALAGDYPGRLFPLGFTTEMPKLLSSADLVITKPGGLTTCECLALGKPMIAVSPIPGQEEANCDFLLENGAAVKAASLSGLIFKTIKLLNEPETLERLSRKAAELGRPWAAKIILENILK